MRISHTFGREFLHNKELPMNAIVLHLNNGMVLVCSDFNHSRKQNLELLVWLPTQKKWVRTYAKNECTEMMWDYYRKYQQKRKKKHINYEKMMEQIDFKKLIRFKTAKVRLHVQPFKYPLVETTINISGETTVTNEGNIYARPTLNISGSGNVEVILNGQQIFAIDLGGDTTNITIDTTKMEAYNPDTTVLMNRQVTGDYNLFKIETGNNTVSITGNVTSATISNYTRWL